LHKWTGKGFFCTLELVMMCEAGCVTQGLWQKVYPARCPANSSHQYHLFAPRCSGIILAKYILSQDVKQLADMTFLRSESKEGEYTSSLLLLA
jgi:hypothetical protein